MARLGLLVLLFLGPGISNAGFHEPPDLVGEIGYLTTTESDTLLAIARKHDLGFLELLAANPGVDPWLPGEGTQITLPTAHILPDSPRQGIVINLAEQRLYLFLVKPPFVATFPVGIGRAGRETPKGQTCIVEKRANPTWIPPPSIRSERPNLPAAIPPGPDNPLGSHALDLDWTDIVIHGTNKPLGIGRRVSHGCIRLYPHDIVTLFDLVSIGTPVTIVDQPVKTGWSEDELFLEAHPTQLQGDELESTGHFTRDPLEQHIWRVLKAAGDQADRLDWPLIQRVVAERRGIPVRITK